MSKFYGIAIDKDKNLKRVPIESTLPHLAKSEALQYCREEGWKLENVYVVNGSQYAGLPMHKILFKNIAAERSKKKQALK